MIWVNPARYHDQVRALVVQQLRAYPERYSPFVTEDYDEWVDRMAADKEWGTEVTLRAAADAFGAEIHVFADNLGEGQLYSAYEPSEKKMSKLVRLVFRSNRGDSGHYNSVEGISKWDCWTFGSSAASVLTLLLAQVVDYWRPILAESNVYCTYYMN